jgi:hypothetical protein
MGKKSPNSSLANLNSLGCRNAGTYASIEPCQPQLTLCKLSYRLHIQVHVVKNDSIIITMDNVIILLIANAQCPCNANNVLRGSYLLIELIASLNQLASDDSGSLTNCGRYMCLNVSPAFVSWQ